MCLAPGRQPADDAVRVVLQLIEYRHHVGVAVEPKHHCRGTAAAPQTHTVSTVTAQQLVKLPQAGPAQCLTALCLVECTVYRLQLSRAGLNKHPLTFSGQACPCVDVCFVADRQAVMLAGPRTYADSIQCFNVKLKEFDACKVIFPGCNSLHRCRRYGRRRRWHICCPKPSVRHKHISSDRRAGHHPAKKFVAKQTMIPAAKGAAATSTALYITPAVQHPLLSTTVLTYL